MHKKRKNKSINDLSLRLYDALLWAFIVFCFGAHLIGAHFFFNYFYFFSSQILFFNKIVVDSCCQYDET